MKKRLDLILFEHGFFETKNSASAAILAGNVKINDTPVTKAGQMFDENVLFDEKKNFTFAHVKSVILVFHSYSF